MVIGVTDINTDHHGCVRVLDPDMALGISPGPDITVVLGGKQITLVTQLLTAVNSSDQPLSTIYTHCNGTCGMGRLMVDLFLPRKSVLGLSCGYAP